MSFCCFRSFLALLLGAGVSGGFSGSALAGDKIEFSTASETLAKPKVDRPETEPADAFPAFDFGSPGPQPGGMIYPMTPTPAPAPSRRNNGLSLQNETGRLGSGLDLLEQNDGFERPAWDLHGTNYSFKQDSSASNYFGAARAWETPENANSLGGTDRMDARRGQPDARLDSLNSLERRVRQPDLGFGGEGEKPWVSRRDDPYGSGARTSISDWLKQQNKTSFLANPGAFKSTPLPFDSKASSAWGSPSTLSEDRSLGSPMDSTEPGYTGYREPTASAPPKRLGSQDEGNPAALPAMRPAGDGLALGSQASQPPQARKPLPPPASGPGQSQKGGATLARPKDPNSVFN